MAAAGLGAPAIAALMGHPAAAHAPAPPPGRGRPLRLLYWQAPTILNPHIATGVKDIAGARLF
jgi:peptide/nickel transport system substrate-binding protein